MQSLKNGKTYVGKTSKAPAIRVEEHNKGVNEWTKKIGHLNSSILNNTIVQRMLQKENFFINQVLVEILRSLLWNTQ